MATLQIGVIGGGKVGRELYSLAEELGRIVGSRGAVVVCGGLGGVMEAACKGAKSAGGLTVGILPGSDRSDANEYVEIAVPTGMGHARNVLIAAASDCLVAVGGEFGTLSEIAIARKLGKPVGVLDPWDFVGPGKWSEGLVWGSDPSEVLSKLLRQIAG